MESRITSNRRFSNISGAAYFLSPPFYFYYLVPEFCSSRRHLCALAMAKECPREKLFTTSSMQISPYISFKQYVANLHSLFVDSAGATCESLGVFLCPPDFTDLHRFFMPWASSFSLYLSAVVQCEVFLLIPLSVHQRRL